MDTLVYPCLPLFALVYPCLLMFTDVYPCLPMVTHVNHVYSCLRVTGIQEKREWELA